MSIEMHRRSTSVQKIPSSPRPSPPARKNSEVDMEDGVVDLEAFNQILGLDVGDSTKEFSKALVWAWMDQAETAIEEMEHYLEKGEIESLASKAHYLMGSSSSLGLIKVSRTCQTLYRLHFPPNLAHFRNYSYQSNYSGSFTSTSSGSSGTSRTTTPTTSPEIEVAPRLGSTAGEKEKAAQGPMDFELEKTQRGNDSLDLLKLQIQEASDWLSKYYKESELYQSAGKTSQTG